MHGLDGMACGFCDVAAFHGAKLFVENDLCFYASTVTPVPSRARTMGHRRRQRQCSQRRSDKVAAQEGLAGSHRHHHLWAVVGENVLSRRSHSRSRSVVTGVPGGHGDRAEGWDCVASSSPKDRRICRSTAAVPSYGS